MYAGLSEEMAGNQTELIIKQIIKTIEREVSLISATQKHRDLDSRSWCLGYYDIIEKLKEKSGDNPHKEKKV